MNRLEAAARAIYALDPILQFYDRPGGPPGNFHVRFDALPEIVRQRAFDQARAAAAAFGIEVEE